MCDRKRPLRQRELLYNNDKSLLWIKDAGEEGTLEVKIIVVELSRLKWMYSKARENKVRI